MMVPPLLKNLIEQQKGEVNRSDRAAAETALIALGIPLESELAEFFLNYQISLFQSGVSDEQLCDIAEPSEEIAAGTQYVREAWQLPERYICLTSAQGEGAYLYEKNTGKVWDFNLASREAFLAGKENARWNGFFEFLAWYLSGEPLSR
jgi:hypothetical protein